MTDDARERLARELYETFGLGLAGPKPEWMDLSQEQQARWLHEADRIAAIQEPPGEGRYTLEVDVPPEPGAGLPGIFERVHVTLESGEPLGDAGGLEWKEFLLGAFRDWFDTPHVRLIEDDDPDPEGTKLDQLADERRKQAAYWDELQGET